MPEAKKYVGGLFAVVKCKNGGYHAYLTWPGEKVPPCSCPPKEPRF